MLGALRRRGGRRDPGQRPRIDGPGRLRYRRQVRLSLREALEKERARIEHEETTFNDLWRTVPTSADGEEECEEAAKLALRKKDLKLPEENILYFMEKNSPALEPWQREMLRIVRNISQYFYPQKQTKVMNEGCATFVHHYIMTELHKQGRITDGAFLEILHSHSSVLFQPDYDDPRYGGINPYALGFAMMQDIRRICTEPEDEDREWVPEIAGNGDWRGTLKDAWANYRDESFIRQFLSPRLIRDMRLFVLDDDSEDTHYTVGGIHDERGYQKVRESLAHSYDISMIEPDIQVVDVDLRGDRILKLQHTVRDGVQLEERDRDEVLAHVRRLWGYDAALVGVDAETEEIRYETATAGKAADDDKAKAKSKSKAKS